MQQHRALEAPQEKVSTNTQYDTQFTTKIDGKNQFGSKLIHYVEF